MNLTTTAIAAVIALAVTVLCGWRGARSPKVLGPPRLVPWRALMVVSFVALLTLLTHLAGLLQAR